MSRNFIYARVSIAERSIENQVREIGAADFAVDKRRIVTENMSGVTASERLCAHCHKADRLGRNATDVLSTVDHLATDDVPVYCLALERTDLTSSAGDNHGCSHCGCRVRA